MSERSSIFDMIGPVMIGPSSSHTAGVVRIGLVARKLFGQAPEKVIITFYNSFARTYEGHGSDRAILAGVMGMRPDDEGIRNSLETAKQKGLDYVLRAVSNASALHPNTIKVQLSAGEAEIEVVGVSRGGGLISILEIDGFRCNFAAGSPTLVVTGEDIKGSIAFISNIVAHDDNGNIATMTVDRRGKNHIAKLVLELDSGIKETTLNYMRSLKWVHRVEYIPDIDLE